MKILFLPRWYPDRNDPMPGLFVQRQAEAVSRHGRALILYVTPDKRCRNTFETDDSVENHVRVVRVYHQPWERGPGILRKIINAFRLAKAHRIGFRLFRDEKPDLLHVHVLTREAVFAFIYRILTGVPYVITEHWSRYFPQNGTYTGVVRKIITQRVVGSASALIAVSEKLKDAMQMQGLLHPRFTVIPNPVDMDAFYAEYGTNVERSGKKRIIHISCFEDKSKNITGFLKVMKKISEYRDDFTCSLIGDGPDREMILDFTRDLAFSPGVIECPGLKTGKDLVSEIRNADFLVLSSHYETFGSVIIESLACGTPVVSTDVGIAGQVISDTNGLIVSPCDDDALEKAIVTMLEHGRTSFSPGSVRASIGQAFSNKTIGDQLMSLYTSILEG